MGNKSVYLKEFKENQIIRILLLRKLLRRSNKFKGIRVFAKFGIGIIRFEICSNLFQKFLKRISTVCKSTKIKKTYDKTNKKFNENVLQNLEKTDRENSQVEQISEQSLLISGGKEFNQKRFTILNENSIANFQMINQRYFHRTISNKRDQIFIISGQEIQYIHSYGVLENEVFILSSQTFKSMKQIQTPVSVFGCDYTNFNVYVFGGYN